MIANAKHYRAPPEDALYGDHDHHREYYQKHRKSSMIQEQHKRERREKERKSGRKPTGIRIFLLAGHMRSQILVTRERDDGQSLKTIVVHTQRTITTTNVTIIIILEDKNTDANQSRRLRNGVKGKCITTRTQGNF